MGRVVLVGDAAHGMPPFAAQGANQGLEDAVVIATLIIKIIAEQGLDNPEIISK
jgi:2-polyprenyl-6-methoxyphenol hydroxylase-like FAD-dependent oxidoreductase